MVTFPQLLSKDKGCPLQKWNSLLVLALRMFERARGVCEHALSLAYTRKRGRNASHFNLDPKLWGSVFLNTRLLKNTPTWHHLRKSCQNHVMYLEQPRRPPAPGPHERRLRCRGVRLCRGAVQHRRTQYSKTASRQPKKFS